MLKIQAILRRATKSIGSVTIECNKAVVTYFYLDDRENITFSVVGDFDLFCKFLCDYLGVSYG